MDGTGAPEHMPTLSMYPPERGAPGALPTTQDPVHHATGRRIEKLAQSVGTFSVVGAVLLGMGFLIDPTGTYFGANDVPVVKYLPVELVAFALPWLVMGSGRKVPISRSFAAAALLSLFVLLGGLYTVAIQGHSPEESFLGRGLGMTATLTGYYAAFQPTVWLTIERWLWRSGFVVALSMFAGLLLFRLGYLFVEESQLYHEEIFACAAAAVAIYARPRSAFTKATLAPAFLAACVLSLKNTGFLAGAVAGFLISVRVWRRRERRWVHKLTKRTAVVTAVLGTVALAVSAVLLIPERLPTGTPTLRLATYPLRYEQFTASPIVGAMFVGNPDLDLGRRIVQAHSDVLDFLAFGGLLGALLALPIVLAVVHAFREVMNACGSEGQSRFYLSALLPLIGMEMLVNPVWHHPYIALFFWLSLGHRLALMTDKIGGGGPRHLEPRQREACYPTPTGRRLV